MDSGGLTLYAVVVLLSLAGRLSAASTSSPISVSFSLTYIDAESSPLRSPAADPSDLPEGVPMRSFIAAGRALRLRRDTQLQHLRHLRHRRSDISSLRGRLSYENEQAFGDFYLTVPVGNPPQDIIFLVDTGSEFTWTQCSPCLICNDTGAPRFFSQHSSSYLPVPCDSLLCTKSLGFATGEVCGNSSNVTSCVFGVGYGDKSAASGAISVDAFHLYPNFSAPFIFGCAIIDIETTSTSSSGLMGMSAGPFSFISQLFTAGSRLRKSGDGQDVEMAHKFAYCLPNRFANVSAPGTILFGDYDLAPANLSYTKLVPPYGALGDLYYFVSLEGITVGEVFIEVAMEAAGVRPGGTIVDSGTGFTNLVKTVYDSFVEELLKQTAHLNPVSRTYGGGGGSGSGSGSGDDDDDAASDEDNTPCYKAPLDAEQLPQVPLVTLHFAGMVDLELGPSSLLYPDHVDNSSGYFCLAFFPTDDLLNNIGNYQQQDYWVEYNLQTSSLGLAKADCALV